MVRAVESENRARHGKANQGQLKRLGDSCDSYIPGCAFCILLPVSSPDPHLASIVGRALAQLRAVSVTRVATSSCAESSINFGPFEACTSERLSQPKEQIQLALNSEKQQRLSSTARSASSRNGNNDH